MANETLREGARALNIKATDYVQEKKFDSEQQASFVGSATSYLDSLSQEIQTLSTVVKNELFKKEKVEKDDNRSDMNASPRLKRCYDEQKSHQQKIEYLRQLNGGGYPRNISAFIYVTPLIFVGVAEWYVNFSTFEKFYAPIFAIAATVIVGAIFAWASHLHGEYLKQIAEIHHPSVEYRNTLSRKIALIVVTVLLIAAYFTVVFLRWSVISAELGTDIKVEGGDIFGGDDSSRLLWSKFSPTIVINILIWGLGVLYSWIMNEKVPELRETYRDYLFATRRVEKLSKPYLEKERQIVAKYKREIEGNENTIKELSLVSQDLKTTQLLLSKLQPSKSL